MRAVALKCGVVFAVVCCLGAWTARAGSISQFKAADLRIVHDGHAHGHSSSQIILHAPFGPLLGGLGAANGPSVEGILDQLKFKRPGGPSDLPPIGGLLGKPSPVHVTLPGVSPMPEPRTWLLYGFGAVIAAWVVRKELRA